MNEQNPFEAPKTSTLVEEPSDTIIAVAKAQKLIIYAILLNFTTILFVGFPLLAAIINISALIMSLVGMVRLASGLEYSTVAKVLAALCMFIPLVNILVLVSMSSRATKRLKDAGYKVGLLGAKL